MDEKYIKQLNGVSIFLNKDLMPFKIKPFYNKYGVCYKIEVGEFMYYLIMDRFKC